MSAELPPWWAMKNDPDDWIYYQHQFSVSVIMEYSIQPSMSKNVEDSQMSISETATMLRWLQKRMSFRNVQHYLYARSLTGKGRGDTY